MCKNIHINIVFPTERNNPCTLFKFFNNLSHFYDAISFQILKSCLKRIPPFISLLKLLIKTKIYLHFKNILNMLIATIMLTTAHRYVTIPH